MLKAYLIGVVLSFGFFTGLGKPELFDIVRAVLWPWYVPREIGNAVITSLKLLVQIRDK